MAGIQDVLQAVQIGQQQNNQTAAQQQELIAQQAGLNEGNRVLNDQKNQAILENKRQEAEAQMASQNAARAVADSLGANPDTQNFKLAILGNQFWDSFNEVQARDAQITAKKSVGFTDNPLQWLSNQFTLPGEIEARDAVATKGNVALGAMNAINATVLSTATAQKSITESVTKDSIARMMDAGAAEAKMQSNKFKMENLGFSMEGLKVLMANNNQNIDTVFKLNSAQNAAQSLAISAGHLALAQQEASQRAKDRTAALEDKDEARAGWQSYVTTYNAGQAVLGLPPITVGEAKTRKSLGGPAVAKDLEDGYTRGLQVLSTGTGGIGVTPAQSAITIAQKRAPLNPGMEDPKDLLMGALTAAQSQATALGGKVTAETLTPAINQIVKDSTTKMTRDVSKDPGGKNIYRAPDYKSLLDVPVFAATPFAKVVVAPQVAGGGVAVNPDVLIDAGLAAVQTGTLSYNDFVTGFTGMFATAVASNNNTKNFKALNLPLQSTYNSSVYNGSKLPFGRTNVIDLSNRAQVENFLLRRRQIQLGTVFEGAGNDIVP